MLSDDAMLIAAIERIDAANAQDPTLETVAGEQVPAALLYSRRMTAALDQFAPDAPAHLRIAARAQHIRRWEIPRNSYSMDRVGYLKWRTDLGRFHADVTEQILRDVGYDEPTIQRVRDLLTKKQIKADPDTQTLEDVICLVFLEHYFDAFAIQHADKPEKIVNILRRTWRKMSDSGRAAAMRLPLTDNALGYVRRALAEGE